MAIVVGAMVLGAAATAQAAPWSFELPEGYTEQPGAADAQIEALRKQPFTVSLDAQLYLSPDSNVQLTRMTWLMKLNAAPSRASVVNLDRGVVKGAAAQATHHVSDTRHWIGDQLVAESIDDKDGYLVAHRRLYSADSQGIVHILTVICAGPIGQLGDCERAQQTMQLALPDQAPLPNDSPKRETDLAYLAGQITGGLLVAALVIWLVRRRNR